MAEIDRNCGSLADVLCIRFGKIESHWIISVGRNTNTRAGSNSLENRWEITGRPSLLETTTLHLWNLWKPLRIRRWSAKLKDIKMRNLRSQVYILWLVVWNMFLIFPYIGNNNPNWRSYFSEGFKPPTSFSIHVYTRLYTLSPTCQTVQANAEWDQWHIQAPRLIWVCLISLHQKCYICSNFRYTRIPPLSDTPKLVWVILSWQSFPKYCCFMLVLYPIIHPWRCYGFIHGNFPWSPEYFPEANLILYDWLISPWHIITATLAKLFQGGFTLWYSWCMVI